MLDDDTLAQAKAQVLDFQHGYLKSQTEMLEKYSVLIEDYQRLKSDYEETREAREKYKQMAKGQERNPFVLLLVDGDGYIFDDDLLSAGAEGGSRAAQLLNDTLKQSLRARGLENCHIMVRVYCNLAGLSKAASKSRLCGPEKRSLGAFAANFNRSLDLYDMVDAGELKENADYKIRAMLRQFVDNPQCRHIFFAACHDVGYISELTPHINRDRITLVRNYAFHPEFAKLGLRVEDFPNIFRPIPFNGTSSSTASAFASMVTPQPTGPARNENRPTCTHFLKGICKYGKNCTKIHPTEIPNGRTVPVSSSDIKDWRNDARSDISNNPKQFSPYKAPSSAAQKSEPIDAPPRFADAAQHQAYFAATLPAEDAIPANQIPVNKSGRRLDAYIPPPSASERASFDARVASRKLCNKYQIAGACHDADCPYDHDALDPGQLACLKQLSQTMPCPRRGACRALACLYGHICQKSECKTRGGRLYCKFHPQMHSVDLRVRGFEEGSSAQGRGGGGGSEERWMNGGAEGVSGKGSDSPTGMWSEVDPSEDAETEMGGEGAALVASDDDDMLSLD